MTNRPIMIDVPDELYERIRQIADETGRSLQEVLLKSFDLLFGEIIPTLRSPA